MVQLRMIARSSLMLGHTTTDDHPTLFDCTINDDHPPSLMIQPLVITPPSLMVQSTYDRPTVSDGTKHLYDRPSVSNGTITGDCSIISDGTASDDRLIVSVVRDIQPLMIPHHL